MSGHDKFESGGPPVFTAQDSSSSTREQLDGGTVEVQVAQILAVASDSLASFAEGEEKNRANRHTH